MQGVLGEVETVQSRVDGNTLTLTASRPALVVVAASDGTTTTEPIAIEFRPPPHLVYPDEAITIPSGGSASIHIEAVNFSPAVEINFSVEVREGSPYNIMTSQTGNVLTLTATGAAVVEISATDGTTTTDPITIEFISPDTAPVDFNGDGIVSIATLEHSREGSAPSVESVAFFARWHNSRFSLKRRHSQALERGNAKQIFAL